MLHTCHVYGSRFSIYWDRFCTKTSYGKRRKFSWIYNEISFQKHKRSGWRRVISVKSTGVIMEDKNKKGVWKWAHNKGNKFWRLVRHRSTIHTWIERYSEDGLHVKLWRSTKSLATSRLGVNAWWQKGYYIIDGIIEVCTLCNTELTFN